MGNERCYYLAEFNRNAHDYSGSRRYQTITVIRNDRKMKFERDMGDARLFGEEFQLICGVPNGKGGGEALYTVDEALRYTKNQAKKDKDSGGREGVGLGTDTSRAGEAAVHTGLRMF